MGEPNIMVARTYIMTNVTLTRLKNMKRNFCTGCEKPFNVGESVVSKPNRTGRRHYHQKCYDKLFCEVP